MRTVFISGIGKGIGRSLAQKFLSEGWVVIGTSTSGSVSYEHSSLVVLQLDLRFAESIEQCVRAVASKNLTIDVLINNAGVLLDEDETRVVPELLRATLEVNLVGTIALTERLLPYIVEGGHIVNISSTAGSLELTGSAAGHYPGHYPAYKISKTALNMYTRTLADALGSRAIVSSVHPGWVKTEMGGPEADLTPEAAAEGIYDIATAQPQSGLFWFGRKRLPW